MFCESFLELFFLSKLGVLSNYFKEFLNIITYQLLFLLKAKQMVMCNPWNTAFIYPFQSLLRALLRNVLRGCAWDPLHSSPPLPDNGCWTSSGMKELPWSISEVWPPLEKEGKPWVSTLEKENDEQHPEMAFGWFCFSFVCKVKSHENIPSQFTLNISWLEECLSLNCRYNKGKMAYFVSLENLFLIHFLNCFRLQRNLYDIFSHSQSGPLTAASFYKRISK